MHKTGQCSMWNTVIQFIPGCGQWFIGMMCVWVVEYFFKKSFWADTHQSDWWMWGWMVRKMWSHGTLQAWVEEESIRQRHEHNAKKPPLIQGNCVMFSASEEEAEPPRSAAARAQRTQLDNSFDLWPLFIFMWTTKLCLFKFLETTRVNAQRDN